MLKEFNYNILKKEYFIRATSILIVALGYNSIVALQFINPLDLWKWFMLLTMSVSLFLVWPLIKASKFVRFSIAVIIWILNYYLFNYLLPFQGQLNINGIIYYLLYNSLDVIPFPHYFSFILIGTILGDVLFEIYQFDNQKERSFLLRKKIIIPSLFLGLALIILSVLLDSQLSLERTSVTWIIFAMGTNLTLLPLFLVFENLKLHINKRKFKFLYYYSYYSLTAYLLHNVFYFFSLFFRFNRKI